MLNKDLLREREDFNGFTKKLRKLLNDGKEVDAVQLWEVRWESRHGEYHGDTRPEIEVFHDEQLAKDFYDALKNAFKLVRHKSGTNVTITKAK